MLFELISHPACPPRKVEGVSVELKRARNGSLSVTYSAYPTNNLFLPDRGLPWRRDRLWESTCFELFVRPVQENAYLEFNFAPHASWNAYTFTDWRCGMADAEVSDPHMVDSRLDGVPLSHSYRLHVYLLRDAVPKAGAKLSLTAVIEETDGTKSYWALAHPPGDRPDFHHPDCFVAKLP